MQAIMDQFYEFAKSKDPYEYYPYANGDCCANAQFARHIGLNYRRLADDNSYCIHPLLIETESVAQTAPHTWGGIVTRLEARR